MDNPAMSIFAIVMGLLFAVFIFLIFRGIMLWYYRINDRIDIANEQTFLLRKIAEKLGTPPDELVYKPIKKK
jgi:hypothetical protein